MSEYWIDIVNKKEYEKALESHGEFLSELIDFEDHDFDPVQVENAIFDFLEDGGFDPEEDYIITSFGDGLSWLNIGKELQDDIDLLVRTSKMLDKHGEIAQAIIDNIGIAYLENAIEILEDDNFQVYDRLSDYVEQWAESMGIPENAVFYLDAEKVYNDMETETTLLKLSDGRIIETYD